MRKFTHLDALDQPRQHPSKLFPLVVLSLLILIATPPLFELAKVELSHYGLFGLTPRVETPILDALAKQWEYSHGEFRDWVTPLLADRRWSPKFVMPIAFLWAGVAAFMLRRGH
jgi:hypothetical protein